MDVMGLKCPVYQWVNLKIRVLHSVSRRWSLCRVVMFCTVHMVVKHSCPDSQFDDSTWFWFCLSDMILLHFLCFTTVFGTFISTGGPPGEGPNFSAKSHRRRFVMWSRFRWENREHGFDNEIDDLFQTRQNDIADIAWNVVPEVLPKNYKINHFEETLKSNKLQFLPIHQTKSHCQFQIRQK